MHGGGLRACGLHNSATTGNKWSIRIGPLVDQMDRPICLLKSVFGCVCSQERYSTWKVIPVTKDNLEVLKAGGCMFI